MKKYPATYLIHFVTHKALPWSFQKLSCIPMSLHIKLHEGLSTLFSVTDQLLSTVPDTQPLVHWTMTVSTITRNTSHHLPLTWLNPNILQDLIQRSRSFRVSLGVFCHPLAPHSKSGAPPHGLRASGSYPDHRPCWTQYNIIIPLHNRTNADPVYVFCYSHSIMDSKKKFRSPKNKMTSQFIHLTHLINIYWVSSQALQL